MTTLHCEHLQWAKQPIFSHIDCHLMHWRLSNDTHGYGAPHYPSQQHPPPPARHCLQPPLPTPTSHNGNNKHLLCTTVVNSHTHLTPTTTTTMSTCYIDGAWRRPPSPSAAFGNDNSTRQRPHNDDGDRQMSMT
ncbi:hypothetical protein K443DRAFT_96161 [Laccaria amethystina LaAM-08-1]|uniref:Uncharacterized protein n=1 Tax=Laccaria amethystina LaAM-08-1 TaxID=1095629 RepID=A0A0C9WUC6_9AGAR|nr:hypothetical protein K443DRAFT_96161 [Laccaria amethystina LaAM-08-1]